MTWDDDALMKSMKDTFLSPNNNFAKTDKAPINSLSIQQSSSGDATIISDLTKKKKKIHFICFVAIIWKIPP